MQGLKHEKFLRKIFEDSTNCSIMLQVRLRLKIKHKSCTMSRMDQEHIKRRQSELSKQQAIYVAQRAKGHTKQESAIMAGYAPDKNGVVKVEDSKKVQVALTGARAETAKNLGLTKEDIAQGLLDAANMARVMADPSAMTRAYSELGKMLGFYEPEKKKVTHELGTKTIEALKGLPDHELAKLAKGRVIEGEVMSKKEEPDGEPDEDL